MFLQWNKKIIYIEKKPAIFVWHVDYHIYLKFQTNKQIAIVCYSYIIASFF